MGARRRTRLTHKRGIAPGIVGRVWHSCNTPQVAVWGDGQQQLVVNRFFDLKFGMRFEKLPHSGLGIVSWPPRPIGKQRLGTVVDDGVPHDAVTADRHEWRVCLEFGKHVLVRAI